MDARTVLFGRYLCFISRCLGHCRTMCALAGRRPRPEARTEEAYRFGLTQSDASPEAGRIALVVALAARRAESIDFPRITLRNRRKGSSSFEHSARVLNIA